MRCGKGKGPNANSDPSLRAAETREETKLTLCYSKSGLRLAEERVPCVVAGDIEIRGLLGTFNAGTNLFDGSRFSGLEMFK